MKTATPRTPAPTAAIQSQEENSKSAGHLEALDQATRRVSATNIGNSGVKHFRVVNESRFLAVVETLVERQLKTRLESALKEAAGRANAPPHFTPKEDSKSLREEYRARWDEFRARFEEKLKTIEEVMAAHCASSTPPSRSCPPPHPLSP